MDRDNTVVHRKATTVDGIRKMQNSKYVQSDMRGIYSDVKNQLEVSSAKVLFSGTPCQCAGLMAYLGEDYDNLICVDFICHGVPSPLAFQKYLGWLSERFGEEVHSYQFRSKRYGWGYRRCMISTIEMNRHHWTRVFDPYLMCFLQAINYREACYRCKFNSERKYSDITIGDFGGVREIQPDFFDKTGCSVVLANSEKGLAFWNGISSKFDKVDLSYDEICRFNPNLKEPCKRPDARNSVYVGINDLPDSDYVRKALFPYLSVRSVLSYYMPFPLKKAIHILLGRK